MFKVNNKYTETTSIKFIANNESEQIMKQIHRIHACLIIFFNSLLWYNSFAEVRQDSLDLDSIMNRTYYESISVTWTINFNVVFQR